MGIASFDARQDSPLFMNPVPSIAYFVTPHGFGHASRSSAVMEAMRRRCPEVRFELFTTCPILFFEDSIKIEFGYHRVHSDIGIIQLSPLKEDLAATCDHLDRTLPFDNQWVRKLADQIIQFHCQLVVCDIAPLGIAVARMAGVPSVLIENFTWDWIYQRYLPSEQRFMPHITYLAELFRSADIHIQTPPLCRSSKGANVVPPISRRAHSNRMQIRKRLGISEEEKMVLLTMGGVPDAFDFLSTLSMDFDGYLVIPGAETMRSPNEKVILLPTHSSFYHPDLMAAADVLIGKAGYSTVAEAYQCGIPFGYIKRPSSPESAVLEDYIQRHLPSSAIPAEAYTNGDWVRYIPELLKIHRGWPKPENGADAAARFLCDLL